MGENSLCCELFELLWWEIPLSEKCIEKPMYTFPGKFVVLHYSNVFYGKTSEAGLCLWVQFKIFRYFQET